MCDEMGCVEDRRLVGVSEWDGYQYLWHEGQWLGSEKGMDGGYLDFETIITTKRYLHGLGTFHGSL